MNKSRRVPVERIHFAEVGTLPALGEIEDGELFSLSLSNNTTSFTHGLHRFPAKFIPQIPGWALDNLAHRGRAFVDPFMGSGTTLVEGLLRGSGSTVGFDIDPLARMIASAKTSAPSSERIEAIGSSLRRTWRKPARKLVVPMDGVANFEHWFTPDAWGWLQSLLENILRVDANPDERVFVLAVFSSILRWVSKADDQSQKTYVSGTNRKNPPPVPEMFWRAYKRALSGLVDLETKKSSDATALVSEKGEACDLPLDACSVDLMVTSPPYLDSVDYMYGFMLEYFWLGKLLGVPDRSSFNKLRREFIGAKNPSRVEELPGSLVDQIDMDAMLPTRQRAVASYFDLMQRHFAEASRVLAPSGAYVMVVGNSQTTDGIVPVHEALVRLAFESGFHLERVFGYRVRRHYMKFPRAGRGGIILIDWILVMTKRKTGRLQGELRLPLPWATLASDAVAH